MSMFFLILYFCTAFFVFSAILLCILYAWDYSYFRMALVFDVDKKLVKQVKRHKMFIKVSTFISVVLLLLCFILNIV